MFTLWVKLCRVLNPTTSGRGEQNLLFGTMYMFTLLLRLYLRDNRCIRQMSSLAPLITWALRLQDVLKYILMASLIYHPDFFDGVSLF